METGKILEETEKKLEATEKWLVKTQKIEETEKWLEEAEKMTGKRDPNKTEQMVKTVFGRWIMHTKTSTPTSWFRS